MVQVIESVKADAKAVWDILGDFGGIKIGGPVTAFEVTGEGVGATRSITMGGALIVERLESSTRKILLFRTPSLMRIVRFLLPTIVPLSK